VLDRIARTDATIIIEGETGTGKELLARAIHEQSLRASHPFVVYDCRAIAGALLEGELLGHERDALPGATRARAGVFEQACRGTLFFDEICELDAEIQPKLLRVLENHEVRRLGGDDSISVDARVIASSGCDLERLVAAGTFRKDLFYRLAVHRLVIPPLRERPEDISLIAAELLKKLAPEYRLRTAPRIAPETVEILQAHSWPGNIRELRNVLSRAVSLGCTTLVRPEDLLAQACGLQADASIEKIAIEQALLRRRGDMLQSARELGMPRGSFIDKARKYGLC
jgi:two-component system response regulator AtoC